jgi:hypothetical protein
MLLFLPCIPSFAEDYSSRWKDAGSVASTVKMQFSGHYIWEARCDEHIRLFSTHGRNKSNREVIIEIKVGKGETSKSKSWVIEWAYPKANPTKRTKTMVLAFKEDHPQLFDELIDWMRKGRAADISFNDSTGKQRTKLYTLAGFTAAYSANCS